MRSQCSWLRAGAFGLALAVAPGAYAEEGGSGHYLPGTLASFVDTVPPKETFLFRYNLVNYDGSVSANRALPFSSVALAKAHVNVWANGLTMLWRPPMELGDSGNWSFAMSTTVPFVSLDVSGNVATNLPGGQSGPSRHVSDSTNGIGDIVLMPLMFAYKISPAWNVNMRLTLYAPTGSYSTDDLANTGKNYWSYEPDVGVMYWDPKSNVEVSWMTGLTFNQENDKTHYRTGNQFHTELTVAKHFMTKIGLVGFGGTGYYYDQTTDDSGSGATLGAFRSRVSGIGPNLSLITKVGGHDLVAEVKWVHELDATKRPEGDTAFLKVIYKAIP